ncbi:MAG: TetR/AcrR family transcriptional regulator [Solirubrobacteraceae bacterium]
MTPIPLPAGETVPSTRRGPTSTRGTGAAGASSRSKRDEILRTATAYFGENGYEATKLADVAAAVGIGSTALYHYFESKLHCLYVIMADALGEFRSEFDLHVGAHDDYLDALLAVLRGNYDLSDQDVLRNRVLVAEQGLVGVRRTSPREEEARELARARIRDVEFTWATFLVRGMEQGVLPEADPRLLTRALLGLYNSIWHWYRPRGQVSLEEVTEFFMSRQLAVLGLPPELADGDRSALPVSAGKARVATRGTRGRRQSSR